jgi:hypothetical protein
MTASTMICPRLPAVPGNERAIWSWKLGCERSLENRSYFVRCVGTRRLWPETPGLTKRSPAQGAPESCTTHFSSRTSCLEQAASGKGYTACCCAVWCDLGRRFDEQTGGGKGLPSMARTKHSLEAACIASGHQVGGIKTL